jgi:hypothetical protein
MFDNLMAEVEYVKQARGYGILESIVFIQEYETEYSSEVRRELKEFMRLGAKGIEVRCFLISQTDSGRLQSRQLPGQWNN